MKTLRNLVALLLLPVAGLAAQAPAPASAPSGPTPLTLDLASLTPEATLVMGGERRLTGTDDAVWVVDRTGGTLTRVETKGNTPGTPVVVGKQVCADPLVAFKSVWVSECSTPALARLDLDAAKPPVMLTATIRGVGPLVSGVGSVWMIADPAGTILRLDPDTNRAVAEIPVSGGAQALVFAEGALWVAGTTQATVTRINAHTNVVGDSVKVGKGPLALAAGEGALWVLNTGDGTVSRVDQKTSKVSTTITLGVPATGGAIVAGERGVWVSAAGAPLVRIDPTTNQVSHVFSGPGGGAITIASGSLWLAATPTHVWRIDPRRVEATRRF
jgi:streptogramin lyase